MKRVQTQMGLIYTLIVITILLVIALGYVVVTGVIAEQSSKKHESKASPVEVVDVDPYPEVSSECNFDITLADYNAFTTPPCTGGFTRYNITDITADDTKLNLSIIYSDVSKAKTGVFINDSRVTSGIDDINLLGIGIFSKKLFILDKNNNDINVLVFNGSGTKIYDLKDVLNKKKVIDLSTGDTKVNSKMINPSGFKFSDGAFVFESFSNECLNGEKSKGSIYKVVFEGEKFNDPEFMSLINCN